MQSNDTCPMVIVVDDEPAVLELVCDVLDEGGITTVAWHRGAGATVVRT